MGFGLRTLINDVITERFNNIKTALPGVVAKVHRDDLKVDVYIKTQTGEFPVRIDNVRVLYPQSSNCKILFNLDIGDTVMLLFSKHSLLSLQSDQFIYVDELDRWEIENVVAIPGITLDKYLDDPVHGMDITIPHGITIITDDIMTLSASGLYYHDGVSSNRILTEADTPTASIEYITSETEPTLSVERAVIWTETDEHDTPIRMYLISRTDLGQRKVELV